MCLICFGHEKKTDWYFNVFSFNFKQKSFNDSFVDFQYPFLKIKSNYPKIH